MKALWLILAVPAAVATFWIINTAAGTGWAIFVAAPAVFAVFAWDLLDEHRAGRSTSLQRFEEREQQRDRRAA